MVLMDDDIATITAAIEEGKVRALSLVHGEDGVLHRTQPALKPPRTLFHELSGAPCMTTWVRYSGFRVVIPECWAR